MIRLLSVALAAAPFAFGVIRYLQTGSDRRMLWMALAAHIGAGVVMLAGGRRTGVAIAVVALVVATSLAALVAYRLGASAAAGVWPVALVFGFCVTASYAIRSK
jgi:hypothetical protein